MAYDKPWGKDLNREENEEKISRINAAGIINITLENLWRDCYSSMAKGDLVTWNRKLDSIWIILGGDVKTGDKEDLKYNNIDLDIYNTGSLAYRKVGFYFENTENKSLQYQLLKKKSLFLRRLQNSQGKGTAYASEDDFDFE